MGSGAVPVGWPAGRRSDCCLELAIALPRGRCLRKPHRSEGDEYGGEGSMKTSVAQSVFSWTGERVRDRKELGELGRAADVLLDQDDLFARVNAALRLSGNDQLQLMSSPRFTRRRGDDRWVINACGAFAVRRPVLAAQRVVLAAGALFLAAAIPGIARGPGGVDAFLAAVGICLLLTRALPAREERIERTGAELG
jgi:hypothetical protein